MWEEHTCLSGDLRIGKTDIQLNITQQPPKLQVDVGKQRNDISLRNTTSASTETTETDAIRASQRGQVNEGKAGCVCVISLVVKSASRSRRSMLALPSSHTTAHKHRSDAAHTHTTL